MAKVFIYPATSLILSDLVSRHGHTPLSSAVAIRERIQTPGLESPPLQITPEEPKKGLRYAAVDVPSGVRGRMSLIGPIIEQSEAAIIVEDPGWLTGCSGCSRTNELVRLLNRTKGVPVLDLSYPTNDAEAKVFVQKIKAFLGGLK